MLARQHDTPQPLNDASPPLLSPACAAQTIVEMASRGLRCIAVATRDFAEDDAARPAGFFDDAERADAGLTVVAVLGIKDPVR